MANIAKTNQTALAPKSERFSDYIQGAAQQAIIRQAVGGESQKLCADIISVVANNPDLARCNNYTILSSALTGGSLKLSASPQLGQYYLVPFKKKGKNGAPDEMIATFILGAKGYKQLAMRTGQYLDIDVIDIKEGEYKGRDKYTGKQTFEFIDDDDVRENLPTVGYMAYFELLNGFKKTVYWTKTKMLKHADQYSQAFKAEAYEDLQAGRIPDSELWKYSSFWYKDFDGMAHKTMIRHLISQWGIMSTEMQTALAKDGEVFEPQADDSINEFVAEEKASISNDGDFDFFDN